MATPFIQTHTFNGVTVTAIVLDQQEFNEVIEEMKQHRLESMTDEQWNNVIKNVTREKYIPCVIRGTKTEWLFKKYNVACEQLGVVVRGKFSQGLNPERN